MVNYFRDPFTQESLSALVAKTGLRPIELVRGAAAAGLTADTPHEEVIAAMVADPNLIQRPIIETDDRAILARPVSKALELL